MYNLSIFSDRIKEQMFEYDESMKSEHLALKLGVTGATVRSWVNREKELSLENAVRLADFFRCNLDYLIGKKPYERVQPRSLPPFYRRLRAVMEEKNVTRSAMTKRKVLVDSFFTNWANGQKPRLSTVCTVADYLNVSLDYLVGRTDY